MSSSSRDSFTSFVSSLTDFIFFLARLPQSEPALQCWIEVARADVRVSFPIVRGKLLVFLHQVWRQIRSSHRWHLSGWESSLLLLACWMRFSWKGVGFCQVLFLCQLRWLCCSVLHSVIRCVTLPDFHMLNWPFIRWYWGQSGCIVMHNPFCELLDSVC